MPAKSRRWQAQIEISEYDSHGYENYQTIYVYGETMDALRMAARAYLLDKRPSVGFSNAGDHITGRVVYAHSNGLLEHDYFESFQGKVLERGWWRRENKDDSRPNARRSFREPARKNRKL